MQNGNQKNGREKFPESDIMELDLQKENIPEFKKRIENQIQKFREFPPKEYKGKKAPYPCFFLKSVDMYILSNIPNFQGISISIGKDEEGNEVLFLFPVTKRSDPEVVTTQESTLNGETKTTSTVVMLSSGRTPCPPYPHGMTSCP